MAAGGAPLDRGLRFRRSAAQHLAHLVDRAHPSRIARQSAERQHLLSREAHARLHRLGAARGTRRRAADLGRRVAGHDLQPAAAAVDRAVGMGDVALRLLSHREQRRRDTRGHHVRVRSVPLRSHASPGAAGDDLPAADAALLRANARNGLAPRCRVDDGVVRRRGVLLHLLFDLSRDGARADRRGALVEDAGRCAPARHSAPRSPRPSSA